MGTELGSRNDADDAREHGRNVMAAAASGSRTPTLRDVARHASVSHMTVSRVINADRSVRPETRKRVEASIAALNFAPNSAARALSAAQPVKVALLHRFPNPGSLGEYLVHLLKASTLAHATLIIREVRSGEEDRSVVRDLVEEQVRGVILPPPLSDDPELVDILRAHGIAIVATGATRQKSGLLTVGIDEQRAAKAMTEHLLGLGHRRIGFITGHPAHASSDLRLAGFKSALLHAGISPEAELIADGAYNYRSGLVAAERLLTLKHRPTAIFASNDDMAVASVATAHRYGMNVPQHLTVCGFDDTPLATMTWPELTTIHQPVKEITLRAFALVLQVIAGAPLESAPVHPLRHSLIRRGSDGPPLITPATR